MTAGERRGPRILLLTLVFPPDGVSTANLLGHLVDRLRVRGHEFAVVTTTPHYNEDREALASQPLRKRWPLVLFQSERRGVPVYHARMRRKGRRLLGRLVDYAIFHVIGTLAALRFGGRYQAVLAPSPPLTIGLQAMLLARLRGVPLIYNVQEIFPDAAVTLGLIRGRLLIRFLEAMERFVYRGSRYVVVISDRFRDALLRKGVPAAKLRVIPNFVDTEFISPRPQENEFSRQHGLAGKFVILYSGNVGMTQDFDLLLRAAGQLSDLGDVVVVIVGDGSRLHAVQTEVAARGLHNVRLLPYQPGGLVPDIYATSSICVVPMIARTAYETFPSKIYTIMSAGRTAMVTCESDSELSDVVTKAGCGIAVAPGDVDAFVAGVRRLHADRDALAAYGRAGRDYVVRNHSAEAIASRYDELLRQVAAP